jgi:hypothetical protein
VHAEIIKETKIRECAGANKCMYTYVRTFIKYVYVYVYTLNYINYYNLHACAINIKIINCNITSYGLQKHTNLNQRDVNIINYIKLTLYVRAV